MDRTIEEYLNNFIKKDVIITQDGFIKAEYSIEKLKYFIKKDILTITGENNKNILQININQIYSIQLEENIIVIKLDNDLNLTITVKK